MDARSSGVAATTEAWSARLQLQWNFDCVIDGFTRPRVTVVGPTGALGRSDTFQPASPARLQGTPRRASHARQAAARTVQRLKGLFAAEFSWPTSISASEQLQAPARV